MSQVVEIKNSILGVSKRVLAPACTPDEMSWRVNVLRWGLGFIYLWFGVLKLFPGLSSAEAIAGASIELMSFGLLQPEVSLPLLGLAEAIIGAALLTDRFLRLAILSIYFHVAGTLVPLVLLPEMTWSRPPIAASLEGQYIFKNIVTVGAALAISMKTVVGRPLAGCLPKDYIVGREHLEDNSPHGGTGK